VLKRKPADAHADLAPLVAELRAEGKSLREIAELLNGDGHTIRQGRPWGHTQLARLLARAGT